MKRGELFRKGGPHRFKKTGADSFEVKIDLPVGEDGLLARQCPVDDCRPGYFRIKQGTGLTAPSPDEMSCPYCRHSADPNDFATKQQLAFAESIVMREAHKGVERMIKDALGLDRRGRRSLGGGLISIDMELKKSHRPAIRHPREQLLRRDLACPSCGLVHTVFGLASWCPDCGTDVFLAHLAEEFHVLRVALDDVKNRRDRLGARAALRDLENVLEDAISIWEATLKALVRRRLGEEGSRESAECRVGAFGNAFQSVDRGAKELQSLLDVDLFAVASIDDVKVLRVAASKRHVITHNLGVADRKYLRTSDQWDGVGEELSLSEREVARTVEVAERVLGSVYGEVFKSADS